MRVARGEVISAAKTFHSRACPSMAHAREGMREVVFKAFRRLFSKYIRVIVPRIGGEVGANTCNHFLALQEMMDFSVRFS
jgi:hypothetical protein